MLESRVGESALHEIWSYTHGIDTTKRFFYFITLFPRLRVSCLQSSGGTVQLIVMLKEETYLYSLIETVNASMNV